MNPLMNTTLNMYVKHSNVFMGILYCRYGYGDNLNMNLGRFRDHNDGNNNILNAINSSDRNVN